MADQETMTTFGRPKGNGVATARARSIEGGAPADRVAVAPAVDSSPEGMVTSVTGFGEDLLTLVELQARLTVIELRQNLQSAKSSVVLIAIGAMMTISGLPVLLLGSAELLVSDLGMKRGYALLCAGAMAIAVAGCCITIARIWLRRNPWGLPLASEEFTRNINWLRTLLRQSGRGPLSR